MIPQNTSTLVSFINAGLIYKRWSHLVVGFKLFERNKLPGSNMVYNPIGMHRKGTVYLVVLFVLVLFAFHQVTQFSFCSLPSKHDRLVTFGGTHHDMLQVIQDL